MQKQRTNMNMVAKSSELENKRLKVVIVIGIPYLVVLYVLCM